MSFMATKQRQPKKKMKSKEMRQKELSIEAMKKSFEAYKRDKSGVKPLFESMKELSTWLSSKEVK